MERVLPVLAIGAFALVAMLLWRWHFRKSRRLLEQWARANDLEVISAERRYLRRGPFFWRSGKGHEVFHVTVRDAAGRHRHAYVRAGGWWWGMMSDDVAVEWD